MSSLCSTGVRHGAGDIHHFKATGLNPPSLLEFVLVPPQQLILHQDTNASFGVKTITYSLKHKKDHHTCRWQSRSWLLVYTTILRFNRTTPC
jgi:hypothetical protein